MSDRAKNVLARCEREQDTVTPQPGDGLVGGEPEPPHVDEDEVRLHLLEVDRQARLGETLSEPTRAGVVLGEAVDVVLERVDTSRGDDPRLAHRAAEEVLHSPCLGHPLPRPSDERAQRAAQSLGEAEGHSVELSPEVGRSQAGGDARVHEPRAVQVDVQPVASRLGHDDAKVVERPDAPPAPVVRVLEAEDFRRGRVEIAGRVDRLADLLDGEDPVFGRKSLHGQAGVDGRPAKLVAKDVRHGLRQHLVPGRREDPQRDLVRHRCGRQVDGLFLTEKLGPALLERDHRWILALLLVADDSVRHRLAHSGRRLGERVGAEVDHLCQS